MRSLISRNGRLLGWFPFLRSKNISLEIVFHGGLGNQLFQTFYAACVSKEYEVRRVVINKSRLGSYSPPRVFELGHLDFEKIFPAPAVHSESFISYLRLPKLLRRIRGKEGLVVFGNHIIVDGYFQNVTSYEHFDPSTIKACLSALKVSFLGPEDPSVSHSTLHHIRLGDGAFSLDAQKEDRFLEQYLRSNMPKYIMTDKEEAVINVEAKLTQEAATIVESGGLSAGELLNTMGSFGRIKTNGSTLALWAAVLYGRDFETSDNLCATFWALLVQIEEA